MKCLIVGGKGNLGAGCINEFKEMGIKTTSWDIPEDIFSISAVFLVKNGYDLVVNFSVKVDSVSIEIAPDREDYEVNVSGLFHLLKVCKIASVPLIHISTREVIGIRDFRLSSSDSGLQLRQISEHEPCLPRNSYGKTKLIAEWLLSDVENVSVIRLNTCYTDDWSSGKGLVGGLVRRSRLEGQVILDNMGRALRDPLHVRDLAALLLSVFEQSFFGKLIHAGGGQENFVTLKEICKLANNNVVINSGQESDDYGFLMDIGLASSIGWSPKVHFRTWINRI